MCDELAARLRRRDWRDNGDGFRAWLMAARGVDACIEDGLRRAAQDEDWLSFELHLLAGSIVPSSRYSRLLCDVLDRRVPELNNEEVVAVMGEIADPSTVDALERSLWWHPDWDEFHGLGKKAIDALAAISTDVAWTVIEDAAITGPSEIRDWAEATLQHRR